MHPLRAFLVSFAVALALFAAGSSATAAPARCAGADSANLPADEAAASIACLVNAVRVDAGLVPLRDSHTLATLARARRDLLLLCDDFSHLPCGQELEQTAVPYAAPARTWRVGENLQWRRGRSTSPRQVVQRWLASPGHRENMLAPVWREQAIGVARAVPFRGRPSAWVWVHWLGRRDL